jgi:hypothetical protein
MTDQEEARRLLAAAIRRLYDIEDAMRAVHTAAGLVADQIAVIEAGVLASAFKRASDIRDFIATVSVGARVAAAMIDELEADLTRALRQLNDDAEESCHDPCSAPRRSPYARALAAGGSVAATDEHPGVHRARPHIRPAHPITIPHRSTRRPAVGRPLANMGRAAEQDHRRARHRSGAPAACPQVQRATSRG